MSQMIGTLFVIFLLGGVAGSAVFAWWRCSIRSPAYRLQIAVLATEAAIDLERRRLQSGLIDSDPTSAEAPWGSPSPARTQLQARALMAASFGDDSPAL